MILIYTRSAVLVTLVAATLGALALLITGSLGAGVIVTALGLIGISIWYRKGKDGVKRSWPAIFFIPLPILGALLLVFGGLIGVAVDIKLHQRHGDPRSSMLDIAEDSLSHQTFSGKGDSAQAVYKALTQRAFVGQLPDDLHVGVQVREDRVLVLAKMKNLGKVSDAGRLEMLGVIQKVLDEDPEMKSRKRYIALKGVIQKGLVKTPISQEVGKSVNEDPLLEFFGKPPAPDVPTGAAGK